MAAYPGSGSVEICSRCGGNVDMTRFHQIGVAEWQGVKVGDFLDIATRLEATILAVACQQCAVPPHHITGAAEKQEMRVGTRITSIGNLRWQTETIASAEER